VNQTEKRDGECCCHKRSSCDWCISLDEEEMNAFALGGRAELEILWDAREEKETP
jgi:hypothetical protein